jgi:hypothetical protein
MRGLWAAERTAPGAADDRSIENCSRCSAYLGLAAPSFAAPAKSWLCGRCGSAFFAIVAETDVWPPRSTCARPVAYDQVISAATTARPTRRQQVPHRDLHRVLQYLSSFEHTGAEKRRERRHAVALPVMALPLARNFRVSGPAFELSTINISKGGASFMYSGQLEAAYLAIDFSYAGLGFIQALFEVLRVRPFLSAFEIAGRWHCRVNPFNFATTAAPLPE